MPYGIDGIDLLRYVRGNADWASVPVVSAPLPLPPWLARITCPSLQAD